MAERTVMMVFDDPDSPTKVYRRPVPVSRVREMQEKFKSQNARVDTRNFSGTQKFIKGVADFLPTAGQIVGDIGGKAAGTAAGLGAGVATGGAGFVAAPAAVLGAGALGSGAGGALGQAGREGIYELMGLGDAPGTVAGEAAWGAGGSLVGGKIAQGFGKIASPFLMKMALGFKNPYVTKEVVKEAIEQGLPVKAAGSTKIAGNLLENAIKMRQAAADFASSLGGRASRKLAGQEVSALAKRAERRGLEDVGEKLEKRLQKFLTKKVIGPNGVELRIPRAARTTLSRAQEIVTSYDTQLHAYYAKVNKGIRVPFDQLPPREQFFSTIADNLREQIRKVADLSLKEPGAYEKLSAEVGKMGGLLNAFKYAEKASRFPGGAQAVAGAGLAAAGVGNALAGGGSLMTVLPSAAGLLALAPEISSRLAYRIPQTLPLLTPALRGAYNYLTQDKQDFGPPLEQPAESQQFPQ
jgi:hypothetical protein